MDDLSDRERLHWLAMGSSLVAWLAMAALHWQAAQRLPGAQCVSSSAAFLDTNWVISVVMSWTLMTTAMMLPLTIPAVAHVRRSTLKRRREGATALFLLAFMGVWLAMGLLLEGGMRVMGKSFSMPGDAEGVDALTLITLTLAVGVWHASPAYQRLLNRCHVLGPLAVFGFRAHRDATMMGVRSAGRCVAMCGPVMLLTLHLPDWHLAAMVVAALFIASARLDPPRPPLWRPRGLGGIIRWCHWSFLRTPRSPWRIPSTLQMRRQR